MYEKKDYRSSTSIFQNLVISGDMSGSTLKKSSTPEKDLDVSSLTEESAAAMDGEQVSGCQNFQHF